MAAINIRIDRDSSRPLYDQIVDQITKLINDNTLKIGSRLPSMRDLAAEIGVNRNTVGLAYSELESSGVVQTKIGSGTYVKSCPPVISPIEWSGEESGGRGVGSIRMEDALSRRAREENPLVKRLSSGDREGRIELGGLVADREFFPAEKFRQVLSDVVKEMGPVVLDYGSQEGYSPLRRWLAARLSAEGAPVAEENLFMLNGSQQGLDLVAKLLVDEGDAVVVEAPTYHNAIGVFRMYGARLQSVPLDSQGMRADRLSELLESDRGVKLIYCMPNFQNPTGITMSRERRGEIAAIAAHHGVPVLEDSFDAELRYRGEPEPSLREMPGGGETLLLGTFSKILFPGLRLGWLVVPAVFREAFRRIRAYTDLAAGLLGQAAMHRFCEMGYLDDHLKLVCKENRARLAAMLQAMERHFPDGVSWTVPEGGMSLWVTLPAGVDSVELLIEARRAGVNFSPGSLFFAGGSGGDQTLRLSFTVEREERIEEGIARIGAILREKMVGRQAAGEEINDVLL